MLAVVFSFVLFNADSVSQAGQDMANMLGLGRLPLLTGATVYYLKSYALLFVMGFVGATPMPARLGRRISETRLGSGLQWAFLAGVLLVCTAYLVDGSFSPFLYFRF